MAPNVQNIEGNKYNIVLFYFKNFLPFSSTMFLPLPIMGLKEAAMAVKWVRSCIAILFTTWYPEPHTPLFCKREAKTLLL